VFVQFAISPVPTLSSILIESTLMKFISNTSSTGLFATFKALAIAGGKIELVDVPNYPVNGHLIATTFKPIVTAMNPFGPKSGGTQITVQGTGFLETTMMRCKFKCAKGGNVQITQGTWKSSKMVICISPSYSGVANPFLFSVATVGIPTENRDPGICYVTLSMNSAQFQPSGFWFRYFDEPFVSKILPSAGPIKGGTIVTITGVNFTTPNITNQAFWRCGVKTGGATTVVSGGVVMTGPGFVTPDNAAKVIKWAAQGYR
jgi:hypothetical protein